VKFASPKSKLDIASQVDGSKNDFRSAALLVRVSGVCFFSTPA
jgi:hypothetical protein